MEPEAGVRKVQKKKTFSICKATEETETSCIWLLVYLKQNKIFTKYLITIHRLRSNLELFLKVINTTIQYSLLGRLSRILYFEGFDLRAVDTFIQWISLLADKPVGVVTGFLCNGKITDLYKAFTDAYNHPLDKTICSVWCQHFAAKSTGFRQN